MDISLALWHLGDFSFQRVIFAGTIGIFDLCPPGAPAMSPKSGQIN